MSTKSYLSIPQVAGQIKEGTVWQEGQQAENGRRFLLCETCFWCATCLDAAKSPSTCPVCQERKSIAAIPLALDEYCNFAYDPRRGVTMEFGVLEVKGEVS